MTGLGLPLEGFGGARRQPRDEVIPKLAKPAPIMGVDSRPALSPDELYDQQTQQLNALQSKLHQANWFQRRAIKAQIDALTRARDAGHTIYTETQAPAKNLGLADRLRQQFRLSRKGGVASAEVLKQIQTTMGIPEGQSSVSAPRTPAKGGIAKLNAETRAEWAETKRKAGEVIKEKSEEIKKAGKAVKEGVKMMAEGHARAMNPEGNQPYIPEAPAKQALEINLKPGKGRGVRRPNRAEKIAMMATQAREKAAIEATAALQDAGEKIKRGVGATKDFVSDTIEETVPTGADFKEVGEEMVKDGKIKIGYVKERAKEIKRNAKKTARKIKVGASGVARGVADDIRMVTPTGEDLRDMAGEVAEAYASAGKKGIRAIKRGARAIAENQIPERGYPYAPRTETSEEEINLTEGAKKALRKAIAAARSGISEAGNKASQIGKEGIRSYGSFTPLGVTQPPVEHRKKEKRVVTLEEQAHRRAILGARPEDDAMARMREKRFTKKEQPLVEESTTPEIDLESKTVAELENIRTQVTHDLLQNAGNTSLHAQLLEMQKEIDLLIASKEAEDTSPQSTEHLLSLSLEDKTTPELQQLQSEVVGKLIPGMDERESKDLSDMLEEIELLIAEKGRTESNTEVPSAELEVGKFIEDLKIESLISPEFNALTIEQKLLVVRNLQNRIVDIVKEDSNTQYSEDLKSKKWLGKIWAGVKKEKTLKDIEAKTFEKIKDTEEGKQLIAADFAQLVKMADEKSVAINREGQPEIIFIPLLDSDSESDKNAIRAFNTAANQFQQIPYEWGQGKGKNKKQYDKAKTAYDEAKIKVLEIEQTHIGLSPAMTNMMQMDNSVKMQQLLNTHPQVEAEFQRISETSGGKELAKTGFNFLQTITGGKNLVNKGLFAGGWGIRMLTASMGIATGITAPITGAVIGGIRGRVRGKQTLEERKKNARYGAKDTSEERNATFDADQLSKKLEKLIGEAGDSISEKTLTSLSARIEYTLGKIESGEVNFGEIKSSLQNQYKLLDVLNQAMVLRASSSEATNNELEARLEQFSAFAAEKINEKQKKFVNKQMKRGALMGAGFATAGYLVRYAGEHLGWWHGSTEVNTTDPIDAKIPGTGIAANESIQPGSLNEAIHQVNSPDKTPIDLEKIVPKFGAPTEAPLGAHTIMVDTSPLHESAANLENIPHSLETPADFDVTKAGGLEHAYEKLILDHTLPEKLPDGIALDQMGATRALNEAANLVKLTEGHNVAGIRAGRFAEAVNFKNGILHITDPVKFNSILDDLHTHSAKLTEVFKNPDSATGYIKHVNWLEKIRADGMHPTATEAGISGHQEATASHIEDFSHIPGAHVEAVAEAHANVMNAYDGVSAEEHLEAQQQSILNAENGGNVAENIQNAPGETIQEAPKQRIAPDGFLKMDNPATYEPYGKAWVDLSGARGLSAEVLKQVNDVYEQKISEVFPTDTEDVWSAVRNGSAGEMMATKDVDLEEGLAPFVSFLNKLHDITGFNPGNETPFRVAETNEQFIKRALQKVAEMGQLDKVKM
ncbi:MAG: hypothetical protein KBC06_01055 [Candidatus Pacebacteria bacterium]|nr:hypothetical protein [Candidatus Paceibacterota bacterium]